MCRHATDVALTPGPRHRAPVDADGRPRRAPHRARPGEENRVRCRVDDRAPPCAESNAWRLCGRRRDTDRCRRHSDQACSSRGCARVSGGGQGAVRKFDGRYFRPSFRPTSYVGRPAISRKSMKRQCLNKWFVLHDLWSLVKLDEEPCRRTLSPPITLRSIGGASWLRWSVGLRLHLGQRTESPRSRPHCTSSNWRSELASVFGGPPVSPRPTDRIQTISGTRRFIPSATRLVFDVRAPSGFTSANGRIPTIAPVDSRPPPTRSDEPCEVVEHPLQPVPRGGIAVQREADLQAVERRL